MIRKASPATLCSRATSSDRRLATTESGFLDSESRTRATIIVGMNVNKRIARVAVLLAMVGWSLIAPQPALAQLGGSLIVTVTAPASGSTVSGTVPVTASVTAFGALSVRGVQFKLDGSNLGAEDTTAPYSVAWDTTTASNGSHSLTAVARDAAGNRTTSAPVAVTVSNGAPADMTPPAVSITSPASGARVSGTVTMTANASDNIGVVGVQFLLDGVNVGAEVTAAPYSAPWDTTLRAEARIP